MSSLKRRARAVAMAAITDADVRRDPARAFEIALGAARGFLSASGMEARQGGNEVPCEARQPDPKETHKPSPDHPSEIPVE